MIRHQNAQTHWDIIIDRLMNDKNLFQEYLEFAGRLYKYSFANSAMIFQQNPNAKMVAELKTWNRFGRYINRGTKSIVVFDTNGNLRHLFNSEDTNGRKRLPKQWQLSKEFSNNLINELNTKYDTQYKNIEDNFSFLVDKNISDNIPKLMQLSREIKLTKDEYVNLKRTFISSINTMVNSRCDLDGSFGLKTQTDLSAHQIFLKMTKEQFTNFCTIINETAKTSLLEIESNLLTVIKNRRNKNERTISKDNQGERNDIRAGRGNGSLQSTDSLHEQSRGTGTVEKADRSQWSRVDEVDGDELSRQGGISQRDVPMGDNSTIDRHGSGEESGRALRPIPEGTLPTSDNIHRNSEVGEGATALGRPHSENTDSLSSKRIVEDKAVSNDDTVFSVTENEQFAFFENETPVNPDDEIINQELLLGSGFEDGKFRIEKFCKTEPLAKDFADFLKKEYGIGGHSGYNENVLSSHHDSKGIRLTVKDITQPENKRVIKLTWNEVAKKITNLVSSNNYILKDDIEKRIDHAKYVLNNELGIFDSDIDKQRAREILKEYGIEETEIVTHISQNKKSSTGSSDTSQENVIHISQSEKNNAVTAESHLMKNPSLSGDLIDYVFNENYIVKGGQKTRFKANVEAIKTLKLIESENRYATKDEQSILAGYVGWGGIPQAFDGNNDSWSNEYLQLKELLSEDEYKTAIESTLTSFYTPPEVIDSVYSALNRLGFEGGNILEPSMGTGNFFGKIPKNIKDNVSVYGVELDSISGRISKKLYPSAKIQINGFEKTIYNDNSFDVAVGNVPFGDFKLADKKYDKNNFLIHDYFFAKSIDKVKPGGIIAFVTSKGTLDKQNEKVRRYIAERCHLVGAIRLPNNTFKSSAGTDVTSDIIFLQKKDVMSIKVPDWVYVSQTEDGIPVNNYFTKNPHMILGKMEYDKRMQGKFGEDSKITTCTPNTDVPLKEQLKNAVSFLYGKIKTQKSEIKEDDVTSIPADPNVRNFTHTMVGDELYFRENEIMKKVTSKGKELQRKIGLHKVRLATMEVINSQVEGCTDETLKSLQDNLNNVYDDFVRKNGYVSSKANRRCFLEDDDYNTISALEVIDTEKKTTTKADIFTKRTVTAYQEITSVDTPIEALHVAIDKVGTVDIEYMAELCNHTPQEVTNELTEKNIIYLNPQKYDSDNLYAGYEEASEYLSGDVREKLKIAQNFSSEKYPKIERNIKALEKSLPKKLEASEIAVRIGASWIDINDYSAFLNEYADANMETNENRQFRSWGKSYAPHPLERMRTGEYKIERKGLDKSVAATKTYGTSRMNSYTIFENLLNQRDTVIKDRFENPDGSVYYKINQKDTQLATEKARQMKEAFSKWVWEKSERREKYVERYNNLFNCIKGREYDGSHQSFPGMSPSINLREHQKIAVARAKFGGNTLLAHCVGAGKSFEMVAATMEKKRLGIINKACVVVPKHLTLQMATEWSRLYPTSKLLVASPKDFEKNNRQKFIARCVTGDYDAVIMSINQFERIPMSIEYQKNFIEEQLFEITESIKDSSNSDMSVKALQRQEKKLEAKLEKLLSSSKDTSLNFEQLGFDYLVVDEAHTYKNCLVVSKMTNVSGVQTTAAQRSADMLMKCRWLNEKTNYNGVLFATGTPVSNSMVELYSMKRYLRPDLLQNAGLENFDDWASAFGEVVSQLEMKPAGNGFRMKKRFAKFANIPELMGMYKEFADIRTPDMVKLPIPKIKGGKPTIVVSPPTVFQKVYVKSLGERAEAIHNGSVDPSVDNMLKITNEARLLGLDPRCINGAESVNPDSKINKCVDNLIKVYKNTEKDKGVQAVFCDIAVNSDDGKFSIYEALSDELQKRGIPKEEICFASDAKTDEQRQEMFVQLRSGEKRIIVASTSKLGTGANIQDRLAALHHLDIPWRPSDLEQRNGRILRQGNNFKEVDIFHYTTKETFDTYMLNIITTKQKFISQVMTSKEPARVCEDVDEMVLTYSEMQALTSGNPMIKEKIELDNDIARLKLLESEYLKQQYSFEDLVNKTLPQRIELNKELLLKSQKDVDLSNKPGAKDFELTLDGKVYTERKEAGAVFRKHVTNCLMTSESINNIGEFEGFKICVEKSAMIDKCVVVLKGELSYHTDVELDNDLGNIIRIENLKKNEITKKNTDLQGNIKNAQNDLKSAKEALTKPFEHEKELKEKQARIEFVNHELSLDKTEDEVFVDEDTQQKSLITDYAYMSVSDKELDNLKKSNLKFETKINQDKIIIKYDKQDEEDINNAKQEKGKELSR